MYYTTNLEFAGIEFEAQITFIATREIEPTDVCPGEPVMIEMYDIQIKDNGEWIDVTEAVLSLSHTVEAALIKEIEDNKSEWH